MKHVHLSGLFFLMFLGGAMAAATDISGTWAFTERLPNEELHSTFVLKQDGEKVSGAYSGPLHEANITGTVKGDTAVISVAGTNNQGEPLTVTYTGKIVSSTKMTGTLDFGKGITFEWTATKK